MSDEASGLVTIDPTSLQGLGALRLLTSYMNEQAVSAAALRKGAADSQGRERDATAEAADLRMRLAVATNTNDTEKKLRTPRTLFSVLGLAVAGFGVDQFSGGNSPLGIALVVIGVLMVAATNLIAPADGRKS